MLKVSLALACAVLMGSMILIKLTNQIGKIIFKKIGTFLHD